MRAESWHSVPIRICLLITLSFCVYLAASRALGAWRFRQGTPDAIQRAIRWDPTNPAYYDALGTLRHLYSDVGGSNEIIRLYQNATRLSPHDAQFWADLGASYDWAGRQHEALEALQRAQHLFPNSPEINWRLANFYVRQDKIPEALQALAMVLTEDSTAGRRVFTLATNATRNREAILEMLPPQAAVFFDYLNFQIERNDVIAAENVWTRILQLHLTFDLPRSFSYLDALIQHKETAKLFEAQSALAQRFLARVPNSTPGSNLVTNGGFELDILNGGFDWRVTPVEGAVVSLDTVGAFEGSQALRITFDGLRNIDYGHTYQYVLVEPNKRYRFSSHIRVQGITTDSGPRLQVSDAYNTGDLFVATENLVGTSGWLEQQARFTTRADTRLLLVRVIRSASMKLDNRIGGTAWIDAARLSAE